MAKFFRSFVQKTLFARQKNLVSVHDPYAVVARLLRKCQVTGIIDAGASNGRISRRLLRLFPEAFVYAFEPNPSYTEILQKYAAEDSRFQPQFCALSEQEGIVDLHVTGSLGNTSLFKPGSGLKEIDPNGASIKSVEKVEAVTIDGWAKRNGNPSIQLMKFDIQGGELQALRGAAHMLSSSTLVVYTEVLFNSLYNGGAIWSQIDLYLRQHGFVLYDIFKPKYGSNGSLMWGNAIFLHPERLGK
jgi:FkbM family methyltransferase